MHCFPSVLHAFVEIAFTRVDVGMERCKITSAATPREKVPGMASSTWTACPRVATRSVQDPVVPQQEHLPWLQQAKGHETVVTDCGLATAGWKFSLERPLTLSTNRRDRPKLLRWPGNNWHKPEHRRCPKRAFASWRTRYSSRRLR